jgi:hypothetical protein
VVNYYHKKIFGHIKQMIGFGKTILKENINILNVKTAVVKISIGTTKIQF